MFRDPPVIGLNDLKTEVLHKSAGEQIIQHRIVDSNSTRKEDKWIFLIFLYKKPLYKESVLKLSKVTKCSTGFSLT